jgi:hypothetical protein
MNIDDIREMGIEELRAEVRAAFPTKGWDRLGRQALRQALAEFAFEIYELRFVDAETGDPIDLPVTREAAIHAATGDDREFFVDDDGFPADEGRRVFID